MKRREFITLLGAAAAWPVAAQAQQPTMPVIGFLNGTSADAFADARNGFIHALKESSHMVGQNVAIEYRWSRSSVRLLKVWAALRKRSPRPLG
jgi:putative ABC transport system substrate-binding protein